MHPGDHRPDLGPVDLAGGMDPLDGDDGQSAVVHDVAADRRRHTHPVAGELVGQPQRLLGRRARPADAQHDLVPGGERPVHPQPQQLRRRQPPVRRRHLGRGHHIVHRPRRLRHERRLVAHAPILPVTASPRAARPPVRDLFSAPSVETTVRTRHDGANAR